MNNTFPLNRPAAPAPAPAPLLSNADLQAKGRALLDMRLALQNTARGAMGPRSSRGQAGAAIGLVVALGAISGIPGIRDTLYPVAALMVLMCALFCTYMRFSKRPITWLEALDNTLADYVPHNLEAFAEMQSRLKDAGHLDVHIVQDWLDYEQGRHQKVREQARTKFASAFLQRKL